MRTRITICIVTALLFGALAGCEFMNPMPTTAVSKPRLRPRSRGGKTDTIMAVMTPCPIARPIAITTRAAMSMGRLTDIAATRAPPTKRANPIR